MRYFAIRAHKQTWIQTQAKLYFLPLTFWWQVANIWCLVFGTPQLRIHSAWEVTFTDHLIDLATICRNSVLILVCLQERKTWMFFLLQGKRLIISGVKKKQIHSRKGKKYIIIFTTNSTYLHYFCPQKEIFDIPFWLRYNDGKICSCA